MVTTPMAQCCPLAPAIDVPPSKQLSSAPKVKSARRLPISGVATDAGIAVVARSYGRVAGSGTSF